VSLDFTVKTARWCVVTANWETVATILLALVMEDAKLVTVAPPVYKVFSFILEASLFLII
jgi:hypothetical protein